MASTTDPNVGFYQSLLSDMNSNNPNTGLQAAELAQAGPTIAGAGLQLAGTEAQLATVQPQLQQTQQYQNQLAGYQLGQQGIGQQQTNLQQQGTEQSYALQQQGYGQQGAENALNFQRQLQSTIGGEAASGALNSQGSKQAQGDIAQQAQWAQQTLGRQEQQSSGDYARAQQNYALIAQANGISTQELYTRLQQANLTAGEGAQQNVDQLVAQAGTALSGEGQGVGGALANLGLLSGTNPMAAIGNGSQNAAGAPQTSGAR